MAEEGEKGMLYHAIHHMASQKVGLHRQRCIITVILEASGNFTVNQYLHLKGPRLVISIYVETGQLQNIICGIPGYCEIQREQNSLYGRQSSADG